MDQRISLITLGVTDLARSRAFYAALGWKEKWAECPDIAFFQLSGQVLGLFPLAALLNEQEMPGAAPAPGGITLGLNVRTREEIPALCAAFEAAGGKVLRNPSETPWGSFTAYAADPDGHPWEFTWLPAYPLNEKGELWLPETM